jgi:hypothetical protein
LLLTAIDSLSLSRIQNQLFLLLFLQMSRYNVYSAPSTANTGSFQKGDRQDEQGSQSSSDDGYTLYTDAQKLDPELEEGEFLQSGPAWS